MKHIFMDHPVIQPPRGGSTEGSVPSFVGIPANSCRAQSARKLMCFSVDSIHFCLASLSVASQGICCVVHTALLTRHMSTRQAAPAMCIPTTQLRYSGCF